MDHEGQPIVITDIRIPFWRLVVIFVKWTLAAIPATIVIVALFMIIMFIIASVLHIPFESMMMPR
jgi:hypothetical protein